MRGQGRCDFGVTKDTLCLHRCSGKTRLRVPKRTTSIVLLVGERRRGPETYPAGTRRHLEENGPEGGRGTRGGWKFEKHVPKEDGPGRVIY